LLSLPDKFREERRQLREIIQREGLNHKQNDEHVHHSPHEDSLDRQLNVNVSTAAVVNAEVSGT
jgi:hypothetical protein